MRVGLLSFRKIGLEITRAFVLDDFDEFLDRAAEVVVDDHVIECAGTLGHVDFALGVTESLYGPNQSLVLRNLPTGGVEARITLPFRTPVATYYEKDHVELQSVNR